MCVCVHPIDPLLNHSVWCRGKILYQRRKIPRNPYTNGYGICMDWNHPFIGQMDGQREHIMIPLSDHCARINWDGQTDRIIGSFSCWYSEPPTPGKEAGREILHRAAPNEEGMINTLSSCEVSMWYLIPWTESHLISNVCVSLMFLIHWWNFVVFTTTNTQCHLCMSRVHVFECVLCD